jgi:hypothetical protein
MNVKLKRSIDFSAGIVYNDEYMINMFTVLLHMTTVSSNSREQNVAYDRIKYWFDDVMQDSVLISNDSSMVNAYRATGQRVLALPEQPVDQVLGMLLYTKLNAVCEGRIVVTDIEIASIHGDGVIFLHGQDEVLPIFHQPGWWQSSGPNWEEPSKGKRKTEKIISLGRMPEWTDLDLDWVAHSEEIEGSVVFVDFQRNDKE